VAVLQALRQFRSGSYRTYEEWKQGTRISVIVVCFYSSYRTYEEWKLWSGISGHLGLRVLTVPMRNGNLLKMLKCLTV